MSVISRANATFTAPKNRTTQQVAMKRSVAILGKTPSFVRWSLEHPCSLRQIDGDNLPDATFRQLRGVREYSVANQEGRVFENFCVHPDAHSQQVEQALGFGEDEVLEVFGGESAVAQACETCPANTDSHADTNATDDSDLWAGCYGWLAVDGSSLAALGKVNDPSSAHDADFLVREIGNVIGMLNVGTLVETNFPEAAPAWFSFWQNRIPNVPQLLLMEKIFSAVLRRHESQASEPFVDDLVRFIDALTISHRRQLPLHVELVPYGHSDGQQWTVFPHCRHCKYSLPNAEANWSECPACGQPGQSERARKFKVLGCRPYVNLARVLGAEQTKALLQRYESRSTNTGTKSQI